ncbi:MAG: hypothetical protein R2875_12860 [Desulfobacterales bacterium]
MKSPPILILSAGWINEGKNQEQATQLMVYSRDLALSYQKTKQQEEELRTG